MAELLAVVTEKGQVTIPVDIRRKLGIGPREKIAFVVADDGRVEIRRPTFPTIQSLVGIAGKLPRPMEWSEMLEIAHEDAASARVGDDMHAPTGR